MTKETKEYSRIRKAKWVASLTPVRRAAKAILEGRIPGKPGKKALPLAEKKSRREATFSKYRATNMDKIRIRDAELHKKQRAERKKLGIIENKRIYVGESLMAKRKRDSVAQRNRRAQILGNGGTHTVADIKALFFEQKGLCGLCDLKLDADNFHVDHWKPLVKGGSNDKSNLKLLHPRCNLMKSSKDPLELKTGTLT